MTDSRYLVLVNNYPCSENLYAGAFVHRRVMRYRQQGLPVDVFCLSTDDQLRCDIFEGVPVSRGALPVLRNVLSKGEYRKILIHGVTSEMMQAVDANSYEIPVIVWIHGMETESWHRRIFDFSWSLWEIARLPRTILRSHRKLQFMRSLYENKECRRKIKFVFVSKWFKQEIAERDTHCRISDWMVIPNIVDDDLFSYEPKPPEQRSRILCVRSFESRKYANDLSVKAIIQLSKNSFFTKLHFLVIGDGHLFSPTLAPLRGFPNVEIRRQYLTQGEIAAIHKQYGVFLCPTRLDAQGVSMGEAMSSGLVPITNNVSAIPEYLTERQGIMGRPENHVDLAEGIKHLYESAPDFLKMSASAAQMVRRKCGIAKVLGQELDLILS